jgi:hypothetical protein
MITMLIQWGYDPSNPSSISCQLVLGSLPEWWSTSYVNSVTAVLQIHRQFHVNWCPALKLTMITTLCVNSNGAMILQIHRQFHVSWLAVHWKLTMILRPC